LTTSLKPMIDNQTKTMALIEKIIADLPISAIPTTQLIRGLRESGIKMIPNQSLQIVSIVYLGDEGGIGCGIKWLENQESAVITSLTHILVNPLHPLAKEIKAYQNKRIKKLSKIR